MSATFEEARQARQTLSDLLSSSPEVLLLGVVKTAEGFAVKIGLSAIPCVGYPATVLGVPVIVEVVPLAELERAEQCADETSAAIDDLAQASFPLAATVTSPR